MHRPLLATLLAATAGIAAAQTFDPARITADVKTLSSDSYEGRGPATLGETKTVAYIVKQMQAGGLQPGGTAAPDGKRGWTQDVPLLRSQITGSPTLSMAIAGTPTPLTQGDQIAVRAALTGQKSVSIADAPLVFVGYGVTAPERKWDDFKGQDLKGKIAVVLVNDPDFETGDGDFGGKAMTYYGRWTYKYEEAARRGAAGILIVHETAPASYGWATVKNSNTNTMFDIVRQNPAASHTPLEGWIQRDLAVTLFKASGLDFDAEKAKARTRDFRAVPLKATLAANYAVDAQVITSKNVLGRLPGTTRADETVIYSAHWDHLGVGAPDAKGDRIYNGAVDNATGIAALLELGRTFAKAPRTARSLVFLAVTAEEKGLLGSEYYAANPVYPLGKTVGVLNMDSMAVAGPARDFGISGSAKLGLLDMLTAEGAKRNRTFSPEPHPEAGGFYRSDHFPMAKRGVPAVSFDGGSDLVTGGAAAGEAFAQAYTRDRYHQPADEWSASWNLSGMTADLGLLYAVGRDLATGTVWPNWSADSEFKAERDKTASARK
ncbi:M28 family metallopeptidase [Sphingomonas montana]|uniref:M28 family metallopeptidase n=1 Tax=Sphingomonas montana TaxID=1843236 RepID=UPI00096FD8E0|nr:M28 family metallopeptidase [Sphingomonas montana]